MGVIAEIGNRSVHKVRGGGEEGWSGVLKSKNEAFLHYMTLAFPPSLPISYKAVLYTLSSIYNYLTKMVFFYFKSLHIFT